MLKRSVCISLLRFLPVLFFVLVTGAVATALEPPVIQGLLKPNVYKKLSDDREVMVHAELEDLKNGTDVKRYSFYGAMTVRATLAETRQVLLNFPLYAQMIPYVEQVKYNSGTREIDLEGGIWKFRLRSRVRFQELGERYLKYDIVSGHFSGLSGEIIFETRGPGRTLVYFQGQTTGKSWPPRLVIERGAEIVFGFTGRRMRNYIESDSRPGGAPRSTSTHGEGPRGDISRSEIRSKIQGEDRVNDHDNQVPQPRSGGRVQRGSLKR